MDVFATADQVLVEVALPGVPLERMELVLAAGERSRLVLELDGDGVHGHGLSSGR